MNGKVELLNLTNAMFAYGGETLDIRFYVSSSDYYIAAFNTASREVKLWHVIDGAYKQLWTLQ